MTPPGTFERVYVTIRQRLREGVYRPGQRLEPAALADELNASVTPVRDALHRLTGERLVEAPRHEGFRVPMMTEPMLRQLYAWHRDLLLLAVMNHRATALGDAQDSDQLLATASADEQQSELFLALGRSAGNPEHAAAIEAVTDRLEPVRRLEQAFLEEIGNETEEIVRSLRDQDWRALRNSLVRYHRRRDRIVPELLATLLRG